MTKINRNYNHQAKSKDIVDDYEDFGYEVKNARRYQSKQKRTPKFKDQSDYDDTY